MKIFPKSKIDLMILWKDDLAIEKILSVFLCFFRKSRVFLLNLKTLATWLIQNSNEKDTFYAYYPDPLKYKSNCKDFGYMQIKFATLFYRFQSKWTITANKRIVPLIFQKYCYSYDSMVRLFSLLITLDSSVVSVAFEVVSLTQAFLFISAKNLGSALISTL